MNMSGQLLKHLLLLRNPNQYVISLCRYVNPTDNSARNAPETRICIKKLISFHTRHDYMTANSLPAFQIKTGSSSQLAGQHTEH